METKTKFSVEHIENWTSDTKLNLLSDVIEELHGDTGYFGGDIHTTKENTSFLIIESNRDLDMLEYELSLLIDYYEDGTTLEMLRDKHSSYLTTLLTEDEWGYSDEWTTCHNCGYVVRTMADSYSWKPEYMILDDCTLLCSDCLLEDDGTKERVIDELANNPNKANTILSYKDFIDLGFEQLNVHHYESGWYGTKRNYWKSSKRTGTRLCSVLHITNSSV